MLADGLTAQLQRIDCHRWDFFSTQGFINYRRIMHRRDFLVPQEAAVHCGHPIEVDDAGVIVGEQDKPSASVAPASALVHPFARDELITEQRVYASLRISDFRVDCAVQSWKAPRCEARYLSAAAQTDVSSPKPSAAFKGSAQAPFLSGYMRKKMFKGNLSERVEDAKTRVDMDELLTPGDDSEDMDQAGLDSPKPLPAATARTPVVMRVPARTAISPPPQPSLPSTTSSKSRVPLPQLGFSSLSGMTSSLSEKDDVETPVRRRDGSGHEPEHNGE